MSETNTAVNTLAISRELVDSVLEEVRDTPFLELQRQEMGFAEQHDAASFIVYKKLVAQAVDLAATTPPAMESERAGRAVGFLAAHRLLRASRGGPFAERQASDALIAYHDDVVTHPERLERDFRRDWGQQDAVGYLVDEKLTKADSRFGSKLLLIIHGRLANPTQPKFRMPKASDEPRSQESSVPLPRHNSRNLHEVRAAQATDRRMRALTGIRLH